MEQALGERMAAFTGAIAKVSEEVDRLNGRAGTSIENAGAIASTISDYHKSLVTASEALAETQATLDDQIVARRETLDGLLATITSKHGDFEAMMNAFATLLAESLDKAEARAHDISALVTDSSQAAADGIEEQFTTIRAKAEREREQTTEALRAAYNQTSSEIEGIFGASTERFQAAATAMRGIAAEIQKELESTREEVRRNTAEMPRETAEQAAAMRRVISDQIRALNELTDIVTRSGRSLDLSEPAEARQQAGIGRARPAPIAYAALEAPRQEPIRQDVARQEPVRREPVRQETLEPRIATPPVPPAPEKVADPAPAEMARTMPRQDVARQEAARQEIGRQDIVRQDIARQDLARQEPARPEAIRPEPTRQEATPQDLARQDIARQDLARQDLARPEAIRTEPARPEPTRQEPARQELVRQEPARQEPPRETVRPAPPRAAAPPRAPSPPAPRNASVERGQGWLSDLLARASRDEEEEEEDGDKEERTAAAPPPPQPPIPQRPQTPVALPAPPRANGRAAEPLDPISLDIARMIDPAAAMDAWARYRQGEEDVFQPGIYTGRGAQTFEEIRRRYRADQDFRATVDRYIREFERLLTQVRDNDPDDVVTRGYLGSDSGKVYTMLAHAAGRLD
jgi:hypothetical protein